MEKIIVNGQTYNSWAEVPADVQAMLVKTMPDADGNGVPDLLEGKGDLPQGRTTMSSTSITMNGQTYNSLDQLPPEIRDQVKNALGAALGGTTTPAAAAPQPPTPGTPAPGQIVLNGQTVASDQATEKKGFFKRLFGG